MRWFVVLLCFALPVQAQDWRGVQAAAGRMFTQMPEVQLSPVLPDACGSVEETNPDMRYCTSENRIYLRERPDAPVKMAHALAHGLGHAIQVRHGIADIALREVRRRPEDEDALRKMVTGQVACLAGSLLTNAGFLPIDLHALYGDEPFQDSHWGRNPLRLGPKVTTGLEFRADWLMKGQRGGIEICTVGEIDVQVLLRSEGFLGLN